ncbi:rhomboid family intramembrane serine protease [Trichocoleus desertorum AS-A10]|uniref:rhomboid family intramembrane serine protease n=1 Tax=Trichocoleus desertorum TaxID=1481672 RepID=UPI0032973ED9
MIPIGDNLPQRSHPIVTYSLIGLSVGLFLWELQLGSSALNDFLQTWGVVPSRVAALSQDAIAGQWLALPLLVASLVTSLFLHQGFAQLLGNLLFFRVFGTQVEASLGHGAFLVFFVLAGIMTSSLQVLINPTLQAPFIGANGAIAAVLGAYLVGFPKAKIDSILPLVVVFVPLELPVWVYLFWWFVQQATYGLDSFTIPSSINPSGWSYWTQAIGLLLGAAGMKFRLMNIRTSG